ncbi:MULTISPECIES: hypothetical protein [Acetobacter]|uniref:hypothetical protein n=1 Tax=Acetobacter TaxID=434 RepID=UPI000F4D88F1|nr:MULTISPECIES: hypothetical protein [Acetobacter]KAA8397190.1 hypothetical protein FKW22_05325 [Acetobacter sp. DmW_125124]KAA8397736.1 hypothetical protein FKW20_08755 [Acetobacter sp. DmW_125127]KAA8401139.1 hypothetical protein FKW19_00570 [Acetobacter sp. DmW_125128]KAA8404881.1 hypothetical protein FKW32_07330 [Acetobacter sp. DmW_125132]KAA8405503.1 hypothetical protein FKW15_07240 [Acetobacter sp. DmW_125133]
MSAWNEHEAVVHSLLLQHIPHEKRDIAMRALSNLTREYVRLELQHRDAVEAVRRVHPFRELEAA